MKVVGIRDGFGQLIDLGKEISAQPKGVVLPVRVGITQQVYADLEECQVQPGIDAEILRPSIETFRLPSQVGCVGCQVIRQVEIADIGTVDELPVGNDSSAQQPGIHRVGSIGERRDQRLAKSQQQPPGGEQGGDKGTVGGEDPFFS